MPLADSHLLSLVIWVPIIGGAIVLAFGPGNSSLGRWLALATSILTFLISIPLYTGFDPNVAVMQFY